MLRYLSTLVFLFVCLQTNIFAQPDTINTLIQAAHDKQLAQHSEWLKLLHYHDGLFGRESYADDSRFFFSKKGKTDPQAEIEASLKAFLDAPTDDVDTHPQCRFPARFFWLSQQINLLKTLAPMVKCEKLSSWIENLNPGGVTLVFPAAYMNSPSSMFGHTFLRIDRKNQNEKTRLLAYSISYAAEVPKQGDQFSFVWKGLFGGYPGYLNGAPYYDKVIEYNDLEARDIWEYQLNFSQDEVRQLLRHIWELQKIRFDYFFFDENCSFRLLSLLDVARPDLDSTSYFFYHAIPADTVRALVSKDAVRNVVYRPATLSLLRQGLHDLSHKEKGIAIDLSSGKLDAKSLVMRKDIPPKQLSKVLDFAYEYLQYRSWKTPEQRRAYASRSLKLLSARSQLPKTEKTAIVPPLRPDLAHHSARFKVGLGSIDGRSFTELGLKPAFHDLLDNSAGYVSGSEIDFLSIDGRYYFDKDDWQLERLSVVNISALPRGNAFFRPFSWKVNFGWFRHHELEKKQMRAAVKGGGGWTFELTKHSQVSLLGLAQLRSQADFAGKLEGAVGGMSLLSIELPKNIKLSASATHWTFEEDNLSDGQHYQMGVNIPLKNINHAIRIQTEHQDLRQDKHDTLMVSWLKYF